MLSANLLSTYRAIRSIILGSIFSYFTLSLSFGQDDPVRVFMYLNYYQTIDSQYLEVEVKYREEGVFKQLAGVPIDFYINSDTSKNTIGTETTGEDGKVRLDLDEKNILRDEEGFVNFESIFPGNEGFAEASKDLSVKRALLAIEGEIVDSVKALTISGEEIVGSENLNISDADITIFVQRTFSDLPIGEGSFEDGLVEAEFPDDLPGDANGDLWIIARIIEHDEYGTVEVRKQLNWGIPVSHATGEKPRALWSRAPLWIIIAVTMAFTAAWYHYFLSVSKLFKIRKL